MEEKAYFFSAQNFIFASYHDLVAESVHKNLSRFYKKYSSTAIYICLDEYY